MSIRLKKFSYRYAEEVFNAKLGIKNELEDIAIRSRQVLDEVLVIEDILT